MEIPATTEIFINKVESRSQKNTYISSLDDPRFTPSIAVKTGVGLNGDLGIRRANFYIETHNGNIVRAFEVGAVLGSGIGHSGALRVDLMRYHGDDKGAGLAKHIRNDFPWINKKLKSDPDLQGYVRFQAGDTVEE